MKPLAIPLPDSAFRLGILLMMLKTLSAASGIIPDHDGVDDCLSALAAGWLVLSVLRKGLSIRMLAACGVFLLLGLFSAARTGTLSLLLTVLTCLSFCGEDFEASVGFLFFWESVFVLLHVAASVILAWMGYSMETYVGGTMRFNFGFSHPNVFSILLLNLLCMWVWLHFESLKLRHLAGLVATAVFFYSFTDTRSILLAVPALAVLVLLGRWRKLLAWSAAVCVPLLGVFEYILWKLYAAGNAFAGLIDGLLSTRVKLGAYALHRFGPSAFGQDLRYVTAVWDEVWGLGSFTFDDIYSYLTVNCGFVWLAVIGVLFFRAALRGPAKHSVFIILWALYGVVETHVINPFMFFPILLVAAAPVREEERL